MGLIILLMVIQREAFVILPPASNSVALGIVGGTGFTVKVAKNRMTNHVGTAMIVAISLFTAYLLYPNIRAILIASPLTMIGVYYNMVRIKPNHINCDASRALIIKSPTMTEYEHPETENSMRLHIPDNCQPSYNEYYNINFSSHRDAFVVGVVWTPASPLEDLLLLNEVNSLKVRSEVTLALKPKGISTQALVLNSGANIYILNNPNYLSNIII